MGETLRKNITYSNKGGYPSPPYAKPLREVDGELNEIRSPRNANELLRIYYFIDKERQRMVLLNTTIKPSLYEKVKKKRLDKEIQADIEEALRIKKQYLTSQKDYEQLSI